MSLVFLSYAFPPMQYPRAVQVSRLAQYLNLPVAVYAALPDDLTPQSGAVDDTIYPETVRVRRIPRHPLDRQLARIAGKLAPWLLRRPDPERWWAQRAAGTILKTENLSPQDVLVTFSQPASDHIAGLKIKCRTGVRWIACFSDPWVDNPFHLDQIKNPAYARRAERKVIGQADLLTFNSQETIDLVMRKYPPAWRKKCRILEHSYAEAHKNLAASSPGAKDKIIIRHLGNLYGARSPQPLMEALEILRADNHPVLSQIAIELVGHTEHALRDDLIRQAAPVDYKTSLALMHSADILLLIEAPYADSPFLPSKLVEYAGAGRPIFALSPPGTGARVTKEIGGYVADIRDPKAIANGLIRAVQDVQAGRLSAPAAPAARFAPETIAAALRAMIGEISQ